MKMLPDSRLAAQAHRIHAAIPEIKIFRQTLTAQRRFGAHTPK